MASFEEQLGDITKWANDMPAFWSAVEDRGHDIPQRTMAFVEQWIELLIEHRGNLFDLDPAKRLIREREIDKKRRNSRFTNSRVRDQWGGSSGLVPMIYRWQIAQSYVSDMAAAVGSNS